MHRWLTEELSEEARELVGPAILEIQYRLFCHAHGDRLILLLGAYDKGEDVSKKRQQDEIATAKSRLEMWAQQQRLKPKVARRARHPAGEETA